MMSGSSRSADFNAFANENWSRKEDYSEGIQIPYIEQIPGYKMEVFKERFRDVQILKRMLDEFRQI